jgi:Acetyltransferase (GNAT) domain
LTPQITLNCGESAELWLKRTWDLTGDQTNDFFLSQCWIDYYLSQWPASERYGVLLRNDLALAYLSHGTFTSRLHSKYVSLGLNVSSSVGLKDVTLETNGTIGSDAQSLIEHFPSILKVILQKGDWDEIRVDGLLEADARQIGDYAIAQGLIQHTESENRTYFVNLQKIRTEFAGSFINSRSSNTRAQLRKALRAAEQHLGKVELRVAQSKEQAASWLEELAVLHKIRWSMGSQPNGFANPIFTEFQLGLVQTAFDAAKLQMLQLVAGDKPLAYLYNFIYKKQALFYMSGVNYQDTEQFKPGLLAHWFAIEHNLAAGVMTYDFLAGTNRYKESLSTDSANRVCIVLRRPTVTFKIEHWLRQFKRARLKT